VIVLARHIGAEVVVIDIGVGYDFEPQQGLVIDKVGYGTGNIVRGPAMTYEEGVKSINIGIDLMNKWGEKGVDIVGTGDMGIGNTTPSSAILAVLSGREIEDVTGRGTGIDDEGLKRKISTIRKALDINKPNRDDPIDVLSKVGGYEIGGIAGLIIGAAANKIPVVVDGFISCAGALIALRLEPKIKEYIFTSHISVESGHKVFFDIIGDKPLLDLDMRLGEGTGAALGITLIEAGVKIFLEMATFEDAGVTEGRY
jgi:nicotinate-nucleotide--dimethylbenzimidazole phosphoribosyltransferase